MLINTFEINIHWKEHWFIHVYSQLSTKIFLLSLWNIVGERASFVAQLVKNLPAMQETWVWFLGQEDPLEKEMAICSSTPAWKIPWMEEPGRLQSMVLQSRTWLSDFTFQYSCLENPMDRGAWWATVYWFTRVGQDWERKHTWNIENATFIYFPPTYLSIKALRRYLNKILKPVTYI